MLKISKINYKLYFLTIKLKIVDNVKRLTEGTIVKA